MAEFDPKLLRKARELSGLTIGELAARAGLHRVTLTHYENGLNCPAESWGKIEKALRKALDDAERAIHAARKRLT